MICEGSINNMPQVKSDPPPEFVIKVLFEHSHSHLLTVVYGCFYATTRLNSCVREHIACCTFSEKLKVFTI